MSSFKMIFQPLSLLLLTLLFTSVSSGRIVYDFDPVPSSATTPLETDSGVYGGAVIEVVVNSTVRGIQIPLTKCGGASLPLGASSMARTAEVMMPEGSRYQLLLSCPSGLSLSQVSVDLSKSHDRIPHLDLDLEESIAQVWEQRSQGNSSLFNGQKFRYGSFCLDGDGGTSEVPHVRLCLGLTDYRTFVGTNLSSLWERFLVTSEDDSVRCQHTSSPLGNGAIIETSDKKIIVLRRSNNVGEFPGHYVFPGGHPEPMALGIDSHKLEKDGEVLNKQVTQEMFDSITCEVVEETGIPASSLSPPLFIGISRRVLNVRPAMFFFIKCSHHSDDIPRLYSNAEDGFESTQLHTVSMDELKTMTPRMPGCHHGGFALYEGMLQHLKNTNETHLTST